VDRGVELVGVDVRAGEYEQALDTVVQVG